MDVPVEQILLTLFAGSLGVAAFLILMFLATSLSPPGSLRRGSELLFCRTQSKDSSKGPRPESDFTKWALVVIAMALTYSCGVVVEHLSDKWTDNARNLVFWIPVRPVPGDAILRAKAFDRVFNPSNRTEIPADLAQLHGEVEWFFRKNRCSEDSKDGRCRNVLGRVNQAYYRAKNLVYKEQTYFEELQRIQRRIDFTRSLTFLCAGLILSTLIGLALKPVGALKNGKRKRFSRLIQHYDNLSPSKLLALLVVSLLGWFAVIHAWEVEELNFDNRAFGYYLDGIDDPGPHIYATTDLRQRTEYRTFKIRANDKFEPSGIAQIADSNYFIVVNDKGRENRQFVVFHLSDDGSLQEAKGWGYPETIDAKKFEAITRSREKPHVFFAITAFDRNINRDRYRQFVRIEASTEQRRLNVKPIELYPPDQYVAERLGQDWAKVEAIALSPDERYLLVGIRAIGSSHRSPGYGVTILQYDMGDLAAKPQLVLDIDLAELVGRPEGVSSLEFSAEHDKYLLLTSLEDETYPIPRGQVGGHLWVLDRHLPKYGELRGWYDLDPVEFSHKPEGVEAVSDNTVIVVFDDDSDRKSETGSNGMFTLKQNEGVFSAVRLTDLVVRPGKVKEGVGEK